ncbi:hypothetical protein KHS38_09675 [Mucilaginibacter sp. Bleaf8]|uniref:hypothetical protein n=1 Tax=Mucilaginibacter sp. Bleaf8 TaxID=2834430 RepID=UPI001BD03D7C|nr:hypothetical protein [Mucilaginibacter sp. Bleaf8]MBS7564672.1 hypothetical protein [Mucilaginibacter sp. Bleaf8]
MTIQLANALYEAGTLSELFKSGFITDKIFTYREIYLWVHTQMRIHSITKNKAVLEAQGKFDKDERTIWRALNSFTDTENYITNSLDSKPPQLCHST